ncbi:MAG TPA: host attachment protein [Burkholderiales bacterium]|nr:host attachment protein [Burkholderiales bacterium]
MATTWIVAADESRARVLQVTDRETRFTEIEHLTNPAGRAQDRELETDARDRFPGGNSWEPRAGAVEHGADLFAKRVGDYLDHARKENRYDQLVLVAPPKFLGALREELHKEVQKLVADELPKDLSWFNARELEQYFAKGSGRAP